MSTGQRIIKYLAIAFAILLTVGIITGIAALGYVIINKGVIFHIGGSNENERNISENMVSISDNTNEITNLNTVNSLNSLKIELKGTELKILKGEKFEVQTNNKDIKYSYQNGNISVIDESPDEWLFGDVFEGLVTIYIPENIETVIDSDIKVGAGKVYIEKLNTNNLKFKIGAGETTIDNLVVSQEGKINGGAGAIHINSGKLTNFDLDTGVGETDIKADILGNSILETGVGALTLKLDSRLDNYRIDVKKGLGDIRCNNKSIPDNTIIGTGTNYIKLKGGIGQITITTNM